MTIANENTAITTTTTKVVSTLGNFGNGGKFTNIMGETYKGLQDTFGVSAIVADRIARDLASDLGKAMGTGQVKIKLSAINDDGKLNIKAAYDAIKGKEATRPLMLLRALQFTGEAFKSGINIKTTGWELLPALVDYIKEIETKLTEKTSE